MGNGMDICPGKFPGKVREGFLEEVILVLRAKDIAGVTRCLVEKTYTYSGSLLPNPKIDHYATAPVSIHASLHSATK